MSPIFVNGAPGSGRMPQLRAFPNQMPPGQENDENAPYLQPLAERQTAAANQDRAKEAANADYEKNRLMFGDRAAGILGIPTLRLRMSDSALDNNTGPNSGPMPGGRATPMSSGGGGGSSGGGGGGGYSGVMRGDKFAGGVASGSYTQRGAAQDTADRDAAFNNLKAQNQASNNKAGNMFAKPTKPAAGATAAMPPVPGATDAPGTGEDENGNETLWHGGPVMPHPIVVGDKAPGSKAKGPFPEKFVPANPRLRPQIVGKKGPQIIAPKVPGTIIPNKRNLAGLPHFAMGGPVMRLPHYAMGGEYDSAADNQPQDLPTVNVTANVPTVDQELLARSWIKPGQPTQAQQDGITDYGGGYKTIQSPYGSGFAAPGQGAGQISDERGQVDVPRMMSPRAPLPFSDQVFNMNKGIPTLPYKPDVVPAGNPFSTGILPPDTTATRDNIATALRLFPQQMEDQGTPEARASRLADSFADSGLNPATVQQNWLAMPRLRLSQAPAPDSGVRSAADSQAILNGWAAQKQFDPTTGQSGPDAGGGIRAMLSPAARMEYDRTHGANTIHGRDAQLQTELGMIGAQRGFQQKMQLATMKDDRKDQRQLIGIAARQKPAGLTEIPGSNYGYVTTPHGSFIMQKTANGQWEPHGASTTKGKEDDSSYWLPADSGGKPIAGSKPLKLPGNTADVPGHIKVLMKGEVPVEAAKPAPQASLKARYGLAPAAVSGAVVVPPANFETRHGL